LATVVLFFSGIPLKNLTLILIALVAGSVIGAVAARQVKMTAMPQLVALFNGVGGGAAALVAIVEYLEFGGDDRLHLFFTVATVIIGAVAFSGSIVTFLKLQELMTSRTVVIPLGAAITILVALATLGAGIWLIADVPIVNFIAQRADRPSGCCFGLRLGQRPPADRWNIGGSFGHLAHDPHGQGDGSAIDGDTLWSIHGQGQFECEHRRGSSGPFGLGK
jgi:hypothetical protein